LRKLNHKIIKRLLVDEDFKNWVFDPNPYNSKRWNDWLSRNSSYEQEFNYARNIVLGMDFKNNIETPPQSHKDQILQNILEPSNQKKVVDFDLRHAANNRASLLIRITRIAAALVIALSVSIYLLTRPAEVEEDATVTLITKENPKGQKSKMQLPDGTLVWLNAASKVTYKKDFGDTVRLVLLSGEAYFEVAEDASKPFIVRTDQLEVAALGTIFNVNSFQENGHTRVSLMEGKVKVSTLSGASQDSVVLSPGQLAMITSDAGQLQIDQYDEKSAFGWIDKVLYFKEADINSVFATLERWYDTKIMLVNEDKARTTKINAEFRDESLENVLIGLKYTLGYNYELREDKVVIKFN